MATLNPAEHFGLKERGLVAPGRIADMVVFDDLREPRAARVYAAGRLVARDGRMADERPAVDPDFTDSVRVDWSRVDLRIPARGTEIRVIGAIENQLVTRHEIAPARIENGFAVADPEHDLLKMAVIERHRQTGQVGLGFVRGVGLRRGAIATTVAHDHHNLVVLGADDVSMETAARAVAKSGGGMAAADGADLRAHLALPIAGLMSPRPHGQVTALLEELWQAARGLGSKLHDPFMALSFLALEVIPDLKLTDRGLIDVGRMETTSLFL